MIKLVELEKLSLGIRQILFLTVYQKHFCKKYIFGITCSMLR